jgi:hypothetical protein
MLFLQTITIKKFVRRVSHRRKSKIVTKTNIPAQPKSSKHRIQHPIQPLLPPLPLLSHQHINPHPRRLLIPPTHLQSLLLPPILLRHRSSLPNSPSLILIPIQITSFALIAPPTMWPEMLAKMRVAFFAGNFFAADVAHGVPAVADEFVAAGRFDERQVAFGASAFDCCCG